MAIGDFVAGKFRVERVIAAGGMGIVVAARHTTLDQPVAIKFLMPAGVTDENAAARFIREARAAARIDSQHVARVFDCGTLENGVPYMVMEHLVGNDLSQELKVRGPLSVYEAVDIILQALDGVAQAHALGIVHRDIKPSNLFLATRAAGQREVKLLDFGISKLDLGPNAPVDDLTNPTLMLGSPRYMAPEQVHSSKHVDGRADIWSLGVVLHEMLAGYAPFTGTTVGEILGQVLLGSPAPLVTLRPDVPPMLSDIVLRCLRRERAERFRNAGELAAALAGFAPPVAQPLVGRICEVCPPTQGVALVGVITSSGVVPVGQGVSTRPPAMPMIGIQTDPTVGTWATHSGQANARRWIAPVAALVVVAGAAVGWQLSRLHRAGVESAAVPPSSETAAVVPEPPAPEPAPATTDTAAAAPVVTGVVQPSATAPARGAATGSNPSAATTPATPVAPKRARPGRGAGQRGSSGILDSSD